MRRLLRIEQKVDYIAQRLGRLMDLEKFEMARIEDLATKMDEIDAETGEQRTVMDSVKVMVQGLVTVIADLQQRLIDAGTDPTKLAAIAERLEALRARLDANDSEMAELVVANTPTP